jgi:uncharacterized membrane protein YhaH (DUF805 family)
MFKFLFNPNGRVSRADMWLKYLLPYIGLSIVAGIIDQTLVPATLRFGHHGAHGPISGLLDLFYLWPGIAVSAKRYHDRGMTGWWVLFSLLLLIPGIAAMAIGFAHSGLTFDNMDTFDFKQMPQGAALHIGAGTLWLFLVCIIFFVIQYVLPGQQGENKYGPDPRERGDA